MSEQRHVYGASILASIPTLPAPSRALPESLSGLQCLAANLFWTWNPDVQSLFRRLDPRLWAEGATPVRILAETAGVPKVAEDASYAQDLATAVAGFETYMAGGTASGHGGPIAYFCAEYGFHESINLYAGGLGILAGDHCKEASDMGLPFVAVGLFYRRGFFHQMIDWEGRQEHLYPVLKPEHCSMVRVLNRDSAAPLLVSVEMPGRTVHAAVWLAPVGRVPLLLLDTDVEENAPEDRAITSQLYTNTREMRLCQEAVLGVGGVRALRALGIAPRVWHLNEGHSAFLLLERLREQLAGGHTMEEAREAVRRSSVITIHTPVPEGNERFGAELAGSLISPILAGTGADANRVLQLGLGADADPGVFDMTAFALRHCRAANGVSRLHGHTADRTWRSIAGYPVIGVTNGVHMPTWVGSQMASVFAAHGAGLEGGTELSVSTARDRRGAWSGIYKAGGTELWEAHIAQKRALVEFARGRLFAQHARHGEGPEDLRALMEALNPNALLIGFARRFATYKRASLMFSDPGRLLRLLGDSARPVQILFAGKSHPADRAGQALIQEVYHRTRSPEFRGKVFLLEDYDIEVGRHLVQGVDVWLNNPRRPLEASGTSGMKAAVNGVPNVSILDGWWDEAFDTEGDRRNGWAIGGREVPDDPLEQDKADAKDLFRVLEEDVIPMFFDRNAAGVPERWISVMRNAIAGSLWAFSTRRMLEDYLDQMLC